MSMPSHESNLSFLMLYLITTLFGRYFSTEIAETHRDVDEKYSSSRKLSGKARSFRHNKVDEREGETSNRVPPSVRTRRDRVSPENQGKMSRLSDTAVEKKTKRRSSSKKQLEVDTKFEGDEGHSDTPKTDASTPASAITSSARGRSDLRSPGQRNTPSPRVADGSTPLPDFITQTDKYGNAVTPRSQSAIQSARVEHPTGATPHLHIGADGKLHEDPETAIAPSSINNVDACTETLLDSIRIMCCCLLPDDSPIQKQQHRSLATDSTKPLVIAEEKAGQKLQLLPDIHPDDHGKKCLVLDLDETLVHSSFRAVPGADFVIPVQVRICHIIYIE